MKVSILPFWKPILKGKVIAQDRGEYQCKWRGEAKCESLLGNKPTDPRLGIGSKGDRGIDKDSKVSSLEY